MSDLKVGSLFSVQGKFVLVTGGGRGIGKMITEGFASNGATVFITSRDEKACAEAAREISASTGLLIVGVVVMKNTHTKKKNRRKGGGAVRMRFGVARGGDALRRAHQRGAAHASRRRGARRAGAQLGRQLGRASRHLFRKGMGQGVEEQVNRFAIWLKVFAGELIGWTQLIFRATR
jgi:NAD(P)-dependent dehydrogenase (short-subunit alcohol dehydrogenase family)